MSDHADLLVSVLPRNEVVPLSGITHHGSPTVALRGKPPAAWLHRNVTVTIQTGRHRGRSWTARVHRIDGDVLTLSEVCSYAEAL